MGQITRALSDLVQSTVAFIVMIILAVIGFFFTVFVVSTGASLAGFSPSGDFVVLSASLLVVAAIIAGGVSPIGFLGHSATTDRHAGSQPTTDD